MFEFSASCGLLSRAWPDAIRAHHFVVFVLDDVAVPEILAGEVILGFDARDLSRIGGDEVFYGSRRAR